MTVQELIAALQSIDDKTQEIRILSDANNFPDDIDCVLGTGSGILIYTVPEY